MGVMDRLFRRKSAPTVKVSPMLVEVLRAFDGTPQSYGRVYRQLPPVRTVVDFLADQVSTTPIKVYRRSRSGRPEARDHPLAILLRSPNPDLTPKRLLFGVVADLAIYGNAYWRKVQDGRNQWVVPLPPTRVVLHGGDLLAPSQYELLQQNGDSTFLTRDDVVHFRTYNPEDRRYGSSKLEALRAILAEEIEVGRWRQGFWRRAARIEGVLEMDKDAEPLSEDNYERLRVGFEQLYTGPEGSGKTAILEGGTKWHATSFSPKDAEFIQGRQFILEATARVYNIPLAVLSLTDTATFASQKEFHQALYQDTLPPWYELIQSEIDLQLLPWLDPVSTDIYTEFSVEAKLRGSFEEQMDVVTRATGAPFMLRAEARNLFNLPALPSDQGADRLVVPLNLLIGGQPSPDMPALPIGPTEPKDAQMADLWRYFDRQEDVVLRKSVRGAGFDLDRWNLELSMLISPEHAAQLNGWTNIRLMKADGDLEAQKRVFAQLKAMCHEWADRSLAEVGI